MRRALFFGERAFFTPARSGRGDTAEGGKTLPLRGIARGRPATSSLMPKKVYFSIDFLLGFYYGSLVAAERKKDGGFQLRSPA